ncbi:MAG: amidohydrolase family protein [Methanolinea sp.]|nr:amidohydrolase family protein [Methanolinea sp.]
MSAGEILVEGIALLGEELLERPVTLTVQDGRIHRIEELSGIPSGAPWICPALFNAHTHVGDSLAMDIPAQGSLEDLVAPPHGLKHRILEDAPREALVRGMRATVLDIIRSGTAGFADFREGGRPGVEALLAATGGLPCSPVIFGREGGEDCGHGLGVSSTRDVAGLEELVSAARNAGKLVAFHAGERDSSDVDSALAFDPDLLIHCTHATPRQLRECADRSIPIAVCPRANWRLKVARSAATPPIRRMHELGCRVLLGTDNVMFVQPDLWRELSFLYTVYGTDPCNALRSAVAGSEFLSRPFFIKERNFANFLLIDRSGSSLSLSRSLQTSLVNRAGPENIVRKVLNLG